MQPETTSATDRRGVLADGAVSITVSPLARYGHAGAYVSYRGTLEALTAAGCLSTTMIEARERRGPGSSRQLFDEHGESFTLSRSPSKREPNRLELWRSASTNEIAMMLVGVAGLFPEGLPAPAKDRGRDWGEPVVRLPSAAAWRERATEGARTAMRSIRSLALARVSERYFMDEAHAEQLRALSERFETAIVELIERARVVDCERPAVKLQVVVDNTR